MAELVFELGCEELPASQIRRALAQLTTEITTRLEQSLIGFGGVESYATPRRLIVGVKDVSAKQEDETKRQRGPSVKACFDASGAPTKALEGFLKGQKAALEDIENDGEYVWVTKTILGRPSGEVLQEILPAAIGALTFDKTMRWGTARMRFARPIRWILAVLDGEVVPFTLEGVASGNVSRGHRFMGGGEFPAATLDQLLAGLRANCVEPDSAIREELIRRGIQEVSGGLVQATEALIDENTYLTEWPTPTLGAFGEEFLSLPEPVLVTAMAKHEKMFPVRGEDGKITNKFVFVRNGGDEARVSAGNTWVLNCRFNDAKFFYDEDVTHTLGDFLAKTEAMTFQVGLGSVRQRADRLSALMGILVDWSRAEGISKEDAEMAGLYAKADLSTGLVNELSSLQGVVGGEYAAREGFPPAVCQAIVQQYDLRQSLPPETQGQYLGALLAAADQLDRLAACLGHGLAPTGTSDPFALRRAASQLIEIAMEWDESLDSWEEPFAEACRLVAEQGLPHDSQVAKDSLRAIFTQRYEAMLSEVKYDIRGGAVVEEDVLNPRLVRTRCDALSGLKLKPAVVQSLSRPVNLVTSAVKKGEIFADNWDAALDSDEATALAEAVESCSTLVRSAILAEDGLGAADVLSDLAPAIDRYLDTTMIMVEDASIRSARLTLLRAAANTISRVGDIGQLVLS